ncbi:unnamed protein product [Heterobilharzia americana]|nr:unnamed protein product [Heterobilharzia americana]
MRHLQDAAPLNPIRDTPSMRGSLNTVENRQNVSGPLCRQITSSITPSNPLMSHYKSVGLQLTSSNHIVSMLSVSKPLPVQQNSSSILSSNSLSSPIQHNSLVKALSSSMSSVLSSPSTICTSMPFSNHIYPSYYSSFSHSVKPISSVKPYSTSNHTHSELSDMHDQKCKSFHQVIDRLNLPTTSSIMNSSGEGCAYHSIPINLSTNSLLCQRKTFQIPCSSVFDFSPPKAANITSNNNDYLSINSHSNNIQLPLSGLNTSSSSSSPSSSLFASKTTPITTQYSTVSSIQMIDSDNNDSNNDDGITDNLSSPNGFKSCLIDSTICNLNVSKKCGSPVSSSSKVENLSTSLVSNCSTDEEQSQGLPRFNLRYANVLHYPKYSNRRNSGFERRLKHTGLVLDAKSTLRLLRKFLQPFINRDVDQLVKKYMDNFILLAVNNIREALGEQSVSESDLNRFRQSLIRRVALRYFSERSQSYTVNPQGHANNSMQETSTSNLSVQKENNIKQSNMSVISQSKTTSLCSSASKCANVKLQSRILTPDSLESISVSNSPRLSSTATCDSISSSEKPLFSTDNLDDRTNKTLQSVQTNECRPASQDYESQYSLRNNASFRSSRKRAHPSNHSTATGLHENSTFGRNSPAKINCESLTSDCNVNDSSEKYPCLPLYSQSPSSASSNSTIGFFRDACSSDSEETLMGSNATVSEPGNAVTKLSAYKSNYSPVGLRSITHSNTQSRRIKSKASRGRKTPWWDRTRAKKSKPSNNKNNNRQRNKTEYGKYKDKLMNDKSLPTQNDNQPSKMASSQPTTSSMVRNNTPTNDNEFYSENINHDIPDKDESHIVKSLSHLSRKSCIQGENNVDASVTKRNNSQKFKFDQTTQFALGSSANTWLGMGTARGRIYSKHPELFRYACDNDDKAWLVQTGIIISHGVRAYLVHAEQVYQIAGEMNACKTKSTFVGRSETLRTFKLPQWILLKVKNAASNHRFFISETKSLNTKSSKMKSSSSSSSNQFGALPETDISSTITSDKSNIYNSLLPLNRIKSIDSVTEDFQNSSVIISAPSSSFMTSKSSLNTLSYQERDNDQDEYNDTSSTNKNDSKLKNRSTVHHHHQYYSKTVVVDSTSKSVHHSQPSPNPPTLERLIILIITIPDENIY